MSSRETLGFIGPVAACVAAVCIGGWIGQETKLGSNEAPVNDARKCLNYVTEHPNVEGVFVPPASVPQSVLRACGLEKYVNPDVPIEVSDKEGINSGVQLKIDAFSVKLPRKDALANKIDRFEDPSVGRALGVFSGAAIFAAGYTVSIVIAPGQRKRRSYAD